MPLTLDKNDARFQIRAYEPGRIQINEKTYTTSVIVSPNQLIANWAPQTLPELAREHFDDIINLRPAILLIGTGHTLQFPALSVYGDLINHGIGVEIMNTHAACRTYNILTAEDRHVVAALMLN